MPSKFPAIFAFFQLQFSILFCYFASARPVLNDFEDPSKFVFRRNFITRELFYKNLSRIASPEPVKRLRLMVGVNQAASESGFVEVYRIKVRWVEPDYWWDNFQAQQERHYELRCEAEEPQTGNTHTFVKLNIDSSIMGYDEHFTTRRPLPLLLLCGIRCVNGMGLESAWVWTRAVQLNKLYDRSPYRRNPVAPYRRWPHPSFGESDGQEEAVQKPAKSDYFPWRRQLAPVEEEIGGVPSEEAPHSSSFVEAAQSVPSTQFGVMGPESQRNFGKPQDSFPTMRRRFPQWEMLKWRNAGKTAATGEFGGIGGFS